MRAMRGIIESRNFVIFVSLFLYVLAWRLAHHASIRKCVEWHENLFIGNSLGRQENPVVLNAVRGHWLCSMPATRTPTAARASAAHDNPDHESTKKYRTVHA